MPQAHSLTHLDEHGAAHMVDVGHKAETERTAIAQGEVRMAPATLAAIVAGDLPKGDVLGTARIAGIMAAKRTPDLIPLCHPLLLSQVAVDLQPDVERDRRCRRCFDRLRHGQGAAKGHGHRRDPAAGEAWGEER